MGFSVNPVVHAFARDRPGHGVRSELTRPFFASMRMDLERTEHDQESFDRYVYGSAEVVGLMCLRAFVHRAGTPTFDESVLVDGARALGAAFQRLNFLRDLHATSRCSVAPTSPGVDIRSFDEATKWRLVDDVQADLDRAARTVRLLPADARNAVGLAHALFLESTTASPRRRPTAWSRPGSACRTR